MSPVKVGTQRKIPPHLTAIKEEHIVSTNFITRKPAVSRDAITQTEKSDYAVLKQKAMKRAFKEQADFINSLIKESELIESK